MNSIEYPTIEHLRGKVVSGVEYDNTGAFYLIFSDGSRLRVITTEREEEMPILEVPNAD